MAIIINNSSFFSEVVIFGGSYSECTEDVIIISTSIFPSMQLFSY